MDPLSFMRIGFEAARIGFDLVDARGLTRHGTDRFDLIEGDYADTSMAELAALQEAGRAPSHAALYDDALVGAVARAWDQASTKTVAIATAASNCQAHSAPRRRGRRSRAAAA